MSAQTSYGAQGVAVEGDLVYAHRSGFYLSKACETVAGIDFGRVVSKGTTDDDCVLGGSTPLGVAFLDHGQGNTYQSTGKYDRYSQVNIVDRDFVWVRTLSTTGAYRAKAYYNTTTGVFTVTDAPSGSEKIIGYLAQTLTAAGLIKIYVDTSLFYQEADVAAIAALEGAAAGEDAAEDVLADYSTTTAMNTAISTAISDYVNPAPVTSLAASNGNTESVVTWVDPADADLSKIVVEHMLSSAMIVLGTRIVAAAAQTVTVTGLTNDSAYTFRVWAVDTDGNYSPVATTTATPTAG